MCLTKKPKTYLARYDPFSIEDRIETEEGEEIIYETRIYPRRLETSFLKKSKTKIRKMFNFFKKFMKS